MDGFLIVILEEVLVFDLEKSIFGFWIFRKNFNICIRYIWRGFYCKFRIV